MQEGEAPVPARPPKAQSAPKRRKPPPKAPEPVSEELVKELRPERAAKVERRLLEAASAFDAGRFQDAYRILKPLVQQARGVAALQELTGLSLYRLGKWSAAARHLEELHRLTGEVVQHPVLADCYRALRRYGSVDRLWQELRDASPAPEVMAEGRIVVAGALADQGDLQGAIRLLEKGPVRPSKRPPKLHQLRLWYALADLYERVGDTPRARELLARVVAVEPDLADAAERLQALG